MSEEKLAPIHPGEVLLEEFLKPMKISQYQLAKAISVPPRRINEIMHGKRGVSADTALRLGRFFRHGGAVLAQLPSSVRLGNNPGGVGRQT